MKKSKLLLTVCAVVACLAAGSANAAPGHGGHNHMPSGHVVTHVHNAPHPGHHTHHHGGHHHNNQVVHHYHHSNNTGSFILATAILISALI